MALSGIVNTALSGLTANQQALQVTSNNIANAATPGFARSEVNFSANAATGFAGGGVTLEEVERVTDAYLQAASLGAISAQGEAEARAGLLDQIQAQFGTPDNPGSLFARIDTAFQSINTAALGPTNAVSRISAISEIGLVFDEFARLSDEISGARASADAQIDTAVDEVNRLLVAIDDLNAVIQDGQIRGVDVNGALNQQSQLIDEISQFLDVRADPRPVGGVILRTGDGVPLVD
ncbi:MAG: flagellar hook-associated protein FlgK, partial [Maricaulaceae bacterium]